MNDASKPYFVQALDALKKGDRRAGARLLARQLHEGNTSARNLPSVAQLAEHIGEVALAIEARRLAIQPGVVDSLLAYWAALAMHGRPAEALAEIERQGSEVGDLPVVLHFRGNLATQLGRLEEAQALFRRAVAKAPAMQASWFSLAMIKTFAAGDADLSAMERLHAQPGGPPEARATLCYALGKAMEDLGDADRAFAFYAEGAALRRPQRPFDAARYLGAAQSAVADFTAQNLARLSPSGMAKQRSLFVTGLPRSGTTLTEQIILGHSSIADGAEVGLFQAALIPLLGSGLSAALDYQRRSEASDPWGDIGRDYASLIDGRFRATGAIVDKTLGQSLMTGLQLHALPEARIAWLRRSPEDVALSCFRTYFSMGLNWTDSLTDIADYMRADDLLFEHWRALFGERILAVPYEELVAAPAEWSERLQRHFGLPLESGAESTATEARAVSTASVAQVRQPISTARIGRSADFERHLRPFRERYYR